MAYEALVNGLIVGSVYALTAAGLSLVYGVMRVINLAHTELLMLGGYLVIVLAGWLHFPVALAAGAALGAIVLLGFGVDRLMIRPFRRRRQSEDDMLLSTVVVTLGLAFVIANLVFIVMGADVRRVPPLVRGSQVFGAITVGNQALVTIGVTAVTIASLILMLSRSRLGLGLRAVAQNPEAAQVAGINRDLMYGIAFAIGAGLAGLSGIMMGPIYFVYPFMGLTWLIKALIVIIVGGLGSIEGALVASFGLAIAESFLATFVSVHAGTIAYFVVVVLALMIRPQGIFAKGGQLL